VGRVPRPLLDVHPGNTCQNHQPCDSDRTRSFDHRQGATRSSAGLRSQRRRCSCPAGSGRFSTRLSPEPRTKARGFGSCCRRSKAGWSAGSKGSTWATLSASSSSARMWSVASSTSRAIDKTRSDHRSPDWCGCWLLGNRTRVLARFSRRLPARCKPGLWRYTQHGAFDGPAETNSHHSSGGLPCRP